MTIDVQAPDGSAVQFPDGTPSDVITNAMQVHFGKFEGGTPPGAAPAVKPATPEEQQTEAAGQFFKGIPVAGAYVDQAGAALSAAANPVTGVGEKGGTYGERYTANLKRNQEVAKQYEDEHPIASTVTQLGGGIASTLPLAATATGAKLLGLTGKSLPSMMAAGGTSGAAIGAADSAARGQDIGTGAGIGSLFGALAPPVGRAIGATIQGAKNLLPAKAVPQNIVDVAGSRVPLSSGQASGDVATQMMENTALRGGEGQGPQKVAEQFFQGEQAPAVEAARTNISTGLDASGRALTDPHDAADLVGAHVRGLANQRAATVAADANRLGQEHEAIRSNLAPGGQVLANSPYEGADFVSRAVGNAAEQAQGATNAAYTQLRELPGEFHPATFNRLGQNIRESLNAGDQPIRVNPQTTPIAHEALGDMQEILGGPQGIQQVRNEAGQVQARPPITPALVEHARQRLNSFLGDAVSAGRTTGNWSDARAMRGIVGAFDDQVINRLGAGTFMGGDPAAVTQAMTTARGLHAQFRQTFTGQGKGDTVGPIIEQIVGRHEGQAAPPEQIQQWLYGNGATPVKVAQRLLTMFDTQSPEIGAIKQGLFSHLTEPPPGKAFDPQQVADKINGFLTDKGRTLSQIYLSAPERTRLAQYATDLERHAQTVGAPRNDVDKVMAKIAGENGNAPATTSEILQYLHGASGQGSKDISPDLVTRLRATMPPAEFNTVRQSQWERLTSSTDGRTDMGPQKASERIYEFLNGAGKPLSEAMYSPAERQQMSQYAALLKQLVPKPGTVNYSNTAPVLRMLATNALKGITVALGAETAGPVGAIAGMGLNAAGKAMGERSASGRVARSLYGDMTPAATNDAARRRAALIAAVTSRGSQPALTDQGR